LLGVVAHLLKEITNEIQSGDVLALVELVEYRLPFDESRVDHVELEDWLNRLCASR
jgi:hypothetical protein